MRRYIVRVVLGLMVVVVMVGCGDGAVEPLPSPFTAVQAGVLHTCGLVGDGMAYCWGFNEYGQLGDGSRRQRATPVAVLGAMRFTSLSPGGGHTCGITTSDDVWCWGFNLNGQLGDGTLSDRATPGQTAGGQDLATISSGGSYSCGTTGTGTPYCWGWNQFGQLGDGSTVDALQPTSVAGAPAFTRVSTGNFHTCGVTAGGQAYCWGRNDYGQLGDGTTSDHLNPVLVTGGISFAMVDAGFHHSCGIATDGTAYCWGRNQFLQLGLGEEANAQEPAPAAVLGGRGFSQISTGAVFTCAVEQGTGAAFCWGYNGSGQLGASVAGRCTDENGVTFQCAAEPNPVSGGLAFASISAANQHVCALTTAGVAYCWGLGSEGQLGDGSQGRSVFSIEPVRVAGQP